MMDRRQVLGLCLVALEKCNDRYNGKGMSDFQEAAGVVRHWLGIERGSIMPVRKKRLDVKETLKGERACRAFELLNCRTAAGLPGQLGPGYAPTIGELSEAAGYHRSALHHWLSRWRKAGLVTWEWGKVRTLRTTGGQALRT